MSLVPNIDEIENWLENQNFTESVREGKEIPIEIIEDVDNYQIKMDIPGVETNNIILSIDDDVLCIEITKENVRKVNDNMYYYSEKKYGVLSRKLKLPKDVDIDNVETSYKNGVLSVIISKKIKINHELFKLKMINYFIIV